MLINANDPNQPVKAGLQTVISDLNNIVFQIPSMTPFKVKGAEDFIFALSNIVIDRSEYTTPSGVNLSPKHYSPTTTTSICGRDFMQEMPPSRSQISYLRKMSKLKFMPTT